MMMMMRIMMMTMILTFLGCRMHTLQVHPEGVSEFSTAIRITAANAADWSSMQGSITYCAPIVPSAQADSCNRPALAVAAHGDCCCRV